VWDNASIAIIRVTFSSYLEAMYDIAIKALSKCGYMGSSQMNISSPLGSKS